MMEPEPQEGNIEYKLKLMDKSAERIEQLATQMRWRCSTEGNGECIYNLGVEDDGSIVGLTSEEYSMTIDTIKKIANMNNYHITQLSKTETENDQKYMYELLIRENNNNNYIDINVVALYQKLRNYSCQDYSGHFIIIFTTVLVASYTGPFSY